MSDDKILYHYCSNETFVKIIENETIRISSLEAANDYKEGRWITDQLKKLIKDLPTKGWLEAAQYLIDSSVSRKLAGAIEETMEETLGLAFCMSEKADLLSQWRGYGDDGAGVAIGFSKNELESFLEAYPPVLATSLKPVIYEEEKQRDILKHFVSDFSTGDEVKKRDVLKQVSDLLFFFKNPAFAEEKEWRLLGVTMNNNRLSEDWAGIKFGARLNHLVAYIDMFVTDLKRDAISNIVLGPKNNTNIQHLRIWLNNNNMRHVTLERSSASYR